MNVQMRAKQEADAGPDEPAADSHKRTHWLLKTSRWLANRSIPEQLILLCLLLILLMLASGSVSAALPGASVPN